MVHAEIKLNQHYGKPGNEFDSTLPGDKFVAIINVHGVPEWFSDDDADVLKEKVLRHYPGAEIVTVISEKA